MSLDWNLSSDEEIDSQWEKDRDSFLKAQEVHNETKEGPNIHAPVAARPVLEDFGSEDDDSVDWQDALDDTKSIQDENNNYMKKSPTTTSTDNDTKLTSRKPRRRKRFRYESLPENTREFLQNLHNTHILAYTSHVVYASSLCSETETMALALSLVPSQILESSTQSLPTLTQLETLMQWYFRRIHFVNRIRQHARDRNRRGGAPRRQRRVQPTSTCLTSLEAYADYLSPSYDDDSQLYCLHNKFPDAYMTWLLVSMVRALGWRARVVAAIEDPVRLDLDEDHPVLQLTAARFRRKKLIVAENVAKSAETNTSAGNLGPQPNYWAEVLCQTESGHPTTRWIHVDPKNQWVDQPKQISSLSARMVVAYAIATEHRFHPKLHQDVVKVTDVTPRYSKSFVECLRARGIVRNKKSLQSNSDTKTAWWKETLLKLNDTLRLASGRNSKEAILIDDHDSDHEKYEEQELRRSANDEAIPTSKTVFQTHPLYAIPSVLGNAEVIAPDAAKRMVGMFKGEIVYRRSDVTSALSAKKWLYCGRKVKEDELSRPAKRTKARKKVASKSFKALKSYNVGSANNGSVEQRQRDIDMAKQPLDDGMENLYGEWQTEPWRPEPVGPNDRIPVNEYRNIELELINPGLVHINERGVAVAAKKLGIPYAPCLLGFEGHGGNRTPSIQGIVVHEHNEILIREAFREIAAHQDQKEKESRRHTILRRWKKLIVGILTKDRIEREYGTKRD